MVPPSLPSTGTTESRSGIALMNQAAMRRTSALTAAHKEIDRVPLTTS